MNGKIIKLQQNHKIFPIKNFADKIFFYVNHYILITPNSKYIVVSCDDLKCGINLKTYNIDYNLYTKKMKKINDKIIIDKIHFPIFKNKNGDKFASLQNNLLFLIIGKYDNIIGGDNSIDEKIDISFNHPKVLTNYDIKINDKKDLVWLEKTDGERSIILIENNKVYTIKNNELDYKFDIKGDNFSKRTIFDTEFYNGKYFIFDVIYYNGDDIRDLFYPERMQTAKKIIEDNNSFSIKDYYPVKNWEELIKFTNNYISPITGNIIDGVILQRIDKSYNSKDFTTFKLKKSILNTIDFYMIFSPFENIFYLYLYGTYKDYINNLKREPLKKARESSQNKELAEINVDQNKRLPDKFYILFSSPYIENLHYFKPRMNWNKKDYFPQQIDQINSIMSDIINNPMAYDKKIVELSLSKDGWVPLRVRFDKEFSNSYKNGITNTSIIFSPVTENIYFQDVSNSPFSNDIINVFHEGNKLIRKLIFQNVNAKNVLDLAGGRGGDFQFIKDNLNALFAADKDKDALVRYTEKVQHYMNSQSQHKRFSFNAVYMNLGKNNSKFVKEIKNRYEYPKNGFDLIIMNYAFHYLCYDHSVTRELNKTIKELLNKNGIFILTFYQIPKTPLNLTTFKIESAEKPNDVKYTDNPNWAYMPLPTIDSSGYRIEPLINDEYIKDIDLKIIDDFHPAERFEKELKNIKNIELILDYLKYIRTIIMEPFLKARETTF